MDRIKLTNLGAWGLVLASIIGAIAPMLPPTWTPYLLALAKLLAGAGAGGVAAGIGRNVRKTADWLQDKVKLPTIGGPGR